MRLNWTLSPAAHSPRTRGPSVPGCAAGSVSFALCIVVAAGAFAVACERDDSGSEPHPIGDPDAATADGSRDIDAPDPTADASDSGVDASPACWDAETAQLVPGTDESEGETGFHMVGDHFIRDHAVDCQFEFSVQQCSAARRDDCAGCLEADCVEHLQGRCSCSCATDADCLPGEICLCPIQAVPAGLSVVPQGPRCIPAQCSVSADCPEGQACALSMTSCGIPHGMFCHTAQDECLSDCDCPDDEFCFYSTGPEHWTCEATSECFSE